MYMVIRNLSAAAWLGIAAWALHVHTDRWSALRDAAFLLWVVVMVVYRTRTMQAKRELEALQPMDSN